MNRNTSSRYFALIPASGVGARMQTSTPKQYIPLMGKPVISHVLATFAKSTYIAHTFVVVSKEDEIISSILKSEPQLQSHVTIIYEGGATRQETVRNGLAAMQSQVNDNDWILVHDAARPGLSVALLHHFIETVKNDNVGGLLALPVVDTLKKATQTRSITTVPRHDMWSAQTPQMFRYALLNKAFEQAKNQLSAITDDASAVEMLGLHPQLVTGSPANLKITYPHDIALVEFLLHQLQG